jgi:hypothetical protein
MRGSLFSTRDKCDILHRSISVHQNIVCRAKCSPLGIVRLIYVSLKGTKYHHTKSFQSAFRLFISTSFYHPIIFHLFLFFSRALYLALEIHFYIMSLKYQLCSIKTSSTWIKNVFIIGFHISWFQCFIERHNISSHEKFSVNALKWNHNATPPLPYHCEWFVISTNNKATPSWT